MNSSEWIALAALALNIMVAIIGLTWGLKKIGDHIDGKIEAHRERFYAEVEKGRREAGEACSAIRTKLQEVELYIRDHYVRSDWFETGMGQISSEMRTNFSQMATRLERMEEKIDEAKSVAAEAAAHAAANAKLLK